MRKTFVTMGLLALTLLILVTVIGANPIWRVAGTYLSAWASDASDARKQVLPKVVRDYLKSHPTNSEETAAADQASDGSPTPEAKSPCSSPDVMDTVKSLSGENGPNPFAAALNYTYALDAIRTVSSSSRLTVCEARLTISYDMIVPTHYPEKFGKSEEKRMRVNKPQEVTYKVEVTDGGKNYITIIPCEADILQQQNAEQQKQELEYEMQQKQDQQYEMEERRNDQMQQRYDGGQ